jgi:hydroxypyruvate isomerase
LKELGFQAGLWNWPEHDLTKSEGSGATFSILNGNLRGSLTDDDAKALAVMGYRGPAGMEAFASGEPEAALQAVRTAFTV